MWRANKKGDKNIEEIKINNSERPVDALAEKHEWPTDLQMGKFWPTQSDSVFHNI